MKKLDTSSISDSSELPIKSGTLDHIQSAYQEAIAQPIISSIVNYDSSKIYILYGLINSGSGANYNISSGAVFYSGEVFLVDAASGTLTGANVVTGILGTTFFIGSNADPVVFTDGVSRNVHQIRKINLTPGLSGSGIANYSDFRKCNPAAGPGIGEVKMYVGSTGDFDGSGLGIAENTRGWARCNGLNGTVDLEGRMPIGLNSSDTDFSTIGNPGGNKTAIIAQGNLPAAGLTYRRSLFVTAGNNVGVAGNYLNETAPAPVTGGRVGCTSLVEGQADTDNKLAYFNATTSNMGSGTAMNIMNPYCVVMFIQRIY